MHTDTKKLRTGIVAAALGAALLLGGGTYALWSDSASLSGGTITAGDLRLDAGTMAAYDISADTAGPGGTPAVVNGVTLDSVTGTPIADLSDWRMVPGDTLALAFPYDLTLSGDNLKADLNLDVSKLAESNEFEGLDLQYAVFGDGTVHKAQGAVPSSGVATVATLSPSDSGPVVFVLYATLAATETADQNAVLDLADTLELTLTQNTRAPQTR